MCRVKLCAALLQGRSQIRQQRSLVNRICRTTVAVSKFETPMDFRKVPSSQDSADGVRFMATGHRLGRWSVSVDHGIIVVGPRHFGLAILSSMSLHTYCGSFRCHFLSRVLLQLPSVEHSQGTTADNHDVFGAAADTHVGTNDIERTSTATTASASESDY